MSIVGTDKQIAWARDRDAQRRFLVEITARNFGRDADEQYYFTSETFSDADSDLYQASLTDEITIAQRLPQELLGGAESSGGSFAVDNSLGTLDFLLADDYCLCGQIMTIYGIDPLDTAATGKADYLKLFVGYVEQVVRLSDNAIQFEFTQYGAAANRDTFLHDTATPTPRPGLSYGRVRNATGFLIDEPLLKYYVGSGGVEAIDAVYINAIAQTNAGDNANESALDGATVAAGTYQTCIALGLFRLGSTPDGVVTYDLKGTGTPAVPNEMRATASDICAYIAQPFVPAGVRAPYVPLNTTAPTSNWNLFRANAPQVLSFHIVEATNVLSSMSVLCASVGAVYWYDNSGLVQVEIFKPPALGSSVGVIHTPMDVIGDVRVKMAPTVWRVEMRGRKNYTVQTGEGLPTSITQTRRDELAKDYMFDAIEEDSIVAERYPSAQILQIDSLIDDSLALKSESERQLATHGLPRHIYSMRVYGRTGGYSLLDTWTFRDDRIAPVGVALRIVSVSDSLLGGFTDLELWG